MWQQFVNERGPNVRFPAAEARWMISDCWNKGVIGKCGALRACAASLPPDCACFCPCADFRLRNLPAAKIMLTKALALHATLIGVGNAAVCTCTRWIRPRDSRQRVLFVYSCCRLQVPTSRKCKGATRLLWRRCRSECFSLCVHTTGFNMCK